MWVVFKALRLDEIIYRVNIGTDEERVNIVPWNSPTFRGSGEEEEPAKEMRGSYCSQ